MTIEEYFHDFQQRLRLSSEAREDFRASQFAELVTTELDDSGVIDGFIPCHYQAQRGMRVDGYQFDHERMSIDLFIVDFADRENLESLTRTEVDAIFRRVENFFKASAEKDLHEDLEESSLGYGLAKDIADNPSDFVKVNFYLLSERQLSERIRTIEENEYKDWTFTYHVWDISRLHRSATSKGAKEELIINFKEIAGHGIQCLPSYVDSEDYQAYLLVLPGEILANLYDRYGSRLLEQNVRCFLQARSKVNKGIRATIMNNPEMFFAYNNGIAATARNVVLENDTHIVEVKDLQIVNGGQTIASIFHTKRKDGASLKKIFVQVKLSIVDPEKNEEIVPKISEYSNTQNRVNAADFFSNHPFHIQMEEFSRRLWVPAKPGEVRETKWFYERARGQYADAQAKLSPAEKRKFTGEYPKPQMFTKTDLAKFENVWDEKPTYVNMGAQKNFAQYAKRIGKMWSNNENQFSEFYYKRAISRAILFRATERIVSKSSWYIGGYRANVVAYTLAMLGALCVERKQSIDFMAIWKAQAVPSVISDALKITAKLVNDDIRSPGTGMTNVSEWCKKELCWAMLQSKVEKLESMLPKDFFDNLLSKEEIQKQEKESSKDQGIDKGIKAQEKVFEIGAGKWREVLTRGQEKDLFTPKQTDILNIAAQIPNKLPTEKQSVLLLEVLELAEEEGIQI